MDIRGWLRGFTPQLRRSSSLPQLCWFMANPIGSRDILFPMLRCLGEHLNNSVLYWTRPKPSCQSRPHTTAWPEYVFHLIYSPQNMCLGPIAATLWWSLPGGEDWKQDFYHWHRMDSVCLWLLCLATPCLLTITINHQPPVIPPRLNHYCLARSLGVDMHGLFMFLVILQGQF